MKHKIEFDCQCESCDGTGLYKGFAERDGFAVVCKNCDGTGKVHEVIEYKDFEGRKERKGVKRVLLTNPGIGVGAGKTEKGQVLTLDSFGGLTYDEWKRGFPFEAGTEMRQFTCPAWWYQSADYAKKPDWKECQKCGSFSGCEHFQNKDQCWKKFDRLNKS